MNVYIFQNGIRKHPCSAFTHPNPILHQNEKHAVALMQLFSIIIQCGLHNLSFRTCRMPYGKMYIAHRNRDIYFLFAWFQLNQTVLIPDTLIVCESFFPRIVWLECFGEVIS